jgi:hypothetical protein
MARSMIETKIQKKRKGDYMSKKKMSSIKPVEKYTVMPDAEVLNRAMAVYTGMNGNPNFTSPPVTPADLKTGIDSLSALLAAALDGGKKVIAEKNKQLHAVIKMMRAEGRYVELNCKDDLATFKSSGFEPVSTVKAPPAALTEKIRSIGHGPNSGEIVVKLKAIAKAGSYEFRFGASANGGLPATWTMQSMTSVKAPIKLAGLTPGTIYAFQARALVNTVYTDWSDPATFMCT